MDTGITGEFTPQAIVDLVASQCIGAHFSTEKASGKTTHAYLLRSSSHAASLNDLIENGARRGICNILAPARSTSQLFLKALQSHGTPGMTPFSLAGKQPFVALEPLVVLTKGSMKNSVATRCMVRGIYQKTRAFYQIEGEIIGHVLSAVTRIGYSPEPRTAAHYLQDDRRRSQLSRQPTSASFFDVTSFWASASMATAFLNVWVTYTTLKEGYSDAGRQFRDSNARKLAQKAFDDAMHVMLYTIQT